jgi:hypothetical protein
MDSKMKIFMNLNTLFLFAYLFVGCDKNIIGPENLVPYMSINVGDIRQYYVAPDNFYIQWEVIDKTFRTDSIETFSVIESYIFSNGIFKATTHYFIRDGYLIKTNIDSSLTSANTFNEERLARIYPSDGENFLINIGASDTNKLFMNVKIIDSLETNIITFNKIAEYEQIKNNNPTGFKSFYAQKYGHIGSIINNGNYEGKILLNYLKTNQYELGSYVPFYGNNIFHLKPEFFYHFYN